MQCLHFNEINSHLTIDEQLNLSNNRYQQLGSLNFLYRSFNTYKGLMLFHQVCSRRNS
ncbi:hypothetical protein ACSSVW_000427 [Pseudoalteromonas sp. MBR-15]|jgi:hypothetical protein